MGIKERREREKEEVRGKIIDAARVLFVRDGYHAVSMRKIADAIEYSPTAIYLHFRDKDDLLKEICRSDFAQLAGVFGQIASVTDPIERIRQTGRMYIRFGIENPNHYRLMFMAPAVNEIPLDSDCEQGRGNPDADSYAFLRWSVQQAIDGGRLHAHLTDADLVSQTLWAAVHGVVALTIDKQQDPWLEMRPVDTRAELMVDAILRGLLREGETLAPSPISTHSPGEAALVLPSSARESEVRS